MKNSNVVDFFTGQSYEKITTKDCQTNDELADEYGIYLGVLKQQDSKKIRGLITELNFKREQIDHLTSEWEWLYDEKHTLLQYCLDYIPEAAAKNINLEKDAIFVDEDGHIWLIYDYEKTKRNHS